MKKTITILSGLALVAMSVQATVLRVNNTDTSAPYSSINDAVKAAADGDTIMVEGSSKKYDDATLDKRVVVIGAGYWLLENGIASEATYPSSVSLINIDAQGITLIGLTVTEYVRVSAPKAIITRCRFTHDSTDDIYFTKDGTDNCIIHQNVIAGRIGGNGGVKTYFHQITNNLMKRFIIEEQLFDCYIAYNTTYGTGSEDGVLGSGHKVERNLVNKETFGAGYTNVSTFADNYYIGTLYKDIKTDKDIRDTQLPTGAKGYGAFSGNDPYVISGIPAGPMIEELTIPTSVEEGGTMEITIKLGANK